MLLGFRHEAFTSESSEGSHAMSLRRTVSARLLIALATVIFFSEVDIEVNSLLAAEPVGRAAESVALVIGNADYGSEATLKNPGNDADAMEAALRGLNFSVTKKKNLTLAQMEEAVRNFRRALGKGSLGLFFYSGQGMQVKGEHYLVPIGARMREEHEASRQCLMLKRVLDAMAESESSPKVVILECGRDNPFERTGSRGGLAPGLADVLRPPEGTLIAFSTSTNTRARAEDGREGISPYARRLVAALRSRPADGLDLRDVFLDTSAALNRDTGQEAWIHISNVSKCYLWRDSVPH
jgi:uncharacterized caspase-like protein